MTTSGSPVHFTPRVFGKSNYLPKSFQQSRSSTSPGSLSGRLTEVLAEESHNSRLQTPDKIIRSRTGISPDAPNEGALTCFLLHAVNVPQMDLLSSSDSYVTIQVFDARGQPKSELTFWPVRDNTASPVWNSPRVVRGVEGELAAGDSLDFRMYDYDDHSGDDLIGTAQFKIDAAFVEASSNGNGNGKQEVLGAPPLTKREVSGSGGGSGVGPLQTPATASAAAPTTAATSSPPTTKPKPTAKPKLKPTAAGVPITVTLTLSKAAKASAVAAAAPKVATRAAKKLSFPIAALSAKLCRSATNRSQTSAPGQKSGGGGGASGGKQRERSGGLGGWCFPASKDRTPSGGGNAKKAFLKRGGRSPSGSSLNASLSLLPPTELTFVLCYNRQRMAVVSNAKKKRVFFLVHADCEADHANRKAKHMKGRELSEGSEKIHSDHGLSLLGTEQCEALRLTLVALKTRLEAQRLAKALMNTEEASQKHKGVSGGGGGGGGAALKTSTSASEALDTAKKAWQAAHAESLASDGADQGGSGESSGEGGEGGQDEGNSNSSSSSNVGAVRSWLRQWSREPSRELGGSFMLGGSRHLDGDQHIDRPDQSDRHMGDSDASRYRDFLLASTILCAPQARCIMTALVGLQDHTASGKSRHQHRQAELFAQTSSSSFKERSQELSSSKKKQQQLAGTEAGTEEEEREEEEEEEWQRVARLKKDPLVSPALESGEGGGGGVVLLAALREIHVKGPRESHGVGRGRGIRSRVMTLLKEQDSAAINAAIPSVDWVDSLTRFDEIPVHPNDCWHEWWDTQAESPRILEQRSDDALQALRFLRDEVCICVVPPRFLRQLLAHSCGASVLKQGSSSNLNLHDPALASADRTRGIATVLSECPAVDIPRCGVLCVDFDFTKPFSDCVASIEPLFGTKISRQKRQVAASTPTSHHRHATRHSNFWPSSAPGGGPGGGAPPSGVKVEGQLGTEQQQAAVGEQKEKKKKPSLFKLLGGGEEGKEGADEEEEPETSVENDLAASSSSSSSSSATTSHAPDGHEPHSPIAYLPDGFEQDDPLGFQVSLLQDMDEHGTSSPLARMHQHHHRQSTEQSTATQKQDGGGEGGGGEEDGGEEGSGLQGQANGETTETDDVMLTMEELLDFLLEEPDLVVAAIRVNKTAQAAGGEDVDEVRESAPRALLTSLHDFGVTVSIKDARGVFSRFFQAMDSAQETDEIKRHPADLFMHQVNEICEERARALEAGLQSPKERFDSIELA